MAGNSKNKITLIHADEADFAKLISAAKTEFELLSVCDRIGILYGLPYFSVMRLPTEDDTNLSNLGIVSNWPSFLIVEYDQHKLLENSPIISYLTSATEPLIYDIRKINTDRADGLDSLVTSLFQRHGIYNGVFFSVHLANGLIGSVSFSGNTMTPNDTQIIELNYFANLIFSKIHKFRNEDGAQEFDLKEREVKCLRLTSKGRTSNEIGLIMEISEHTVNQYLTNAIRELDTKNRVHAVSKALRLKIIQ